MGQKVSRCLSSLATQAPELPRIPPPPGPAELAQTMREFAEMSRQLAATPPPRQDTAALRNAQRARVLGRIQRDQNAALSSSGRRGLAPIRDRLSTQSTALVAQWDAWADSAAVNEGGDRRSAVNRLVVFLAAGPQFPTALNLSGLHLHPNLPPLPEGLRLLDISHNDFVEMPTLPTSLKVLKAEHGTIATISNLPEGLEQLSIEHSTTSAISVLPENLTHLNVAGSRLQTIPTLPNALTHLNAAACELTSLPAMGSNVTVLNVEHNRQLTELPIMPASLRRLTASDCGLTRFPELPDDVESALLRRNRITQLPDSLPARIKLLDISDNELQTVPSSLFRLPLNSVVFMTNNSFPDDVLRMFHHVHNGNDPRMPRDQQPNVMMDPAPPRDRPRRAPRQTPVPTPVARSQAVDPMVSAVGAWYPAHQSRDKSAPWAAFQREPGAMEFMRFLNRLNTAMPVMGPQGRHVLKNALPPLLDRMARSPEFRQDCFAVSVGATETCEDRLIQTLNSMYDPILADDVRRGVFDNDVPGLIAQARVHLRRMVLEVIAGKKVSELKAHAREYGMSPDSVDDLETHLAYQVKLNDLLFLGLDGATMKYHSKSRVLPEDLNLAALRVVEMEEKDFTEYLLNHCEPWKQLFQRLEPDEHLHMREAVVEAVMGPAFEERMQASLSELGDLTGPALDDARRELGPEINNKLALEAQLPYAKKFLAQRGHNPALLGVPGGGPAVPEVQSNAMDASTSQALVQSLQPALMDWLSNLPVTPTPGSPVTARTQAAVPSVATSLSTATTQMPQSYYSIDQSRPGVTSDGDLFGTGARIRQTERMPSAAELEFIDEIQRRLHALGNP